MMLFLLWVLSFAPPDSFPAPVRIGYVVTETDSSLRWSQWLSTSERDSRRSDRYTARLTGYLRHDASFIHGHAPIDQRWVLDGIDLRDPVTGLTNPHRIPLLQLARMEERTVGSLASTLAQERDLYLTHPLTWINYEQGPYNLLSTEVVFAANASPKTGFSTRYWGRNDDGEYNSSPTKGRTASIRGYHHLNNDWKLHGTILYSGLQTSEPGGFTIRNYLPSATTPLELGRASVRQSVLRVSATHRTDWDLGLYANRFRRFYKGEVDTTFYRVLGVGAYATRFASLGFLKGDATLRAEHFATDPQRRRSLSISEWSRAELETNVRLGLLSGTWIGGLRTDGGTESRFTATADAGLVYASASVAQRMLSIQQAHWRTSAGNQAAAPTEFLTRVEGGVRWKGVTLSGYLRSTDTLDVAGGFVEYRHESDRWEVGVSSTLQENLSDASYGTRAWNRAWVYWKGYLFERATFVKTGFHATWVPIGYVAPTYNGATDGWTEYDPLGVSIPSFYRVDWDLSARVRNLFFLVRWQHLNQNVGQFGYEETAFYPMPGRGVRFGMRVVLRN
jgi:hypothetical protein